MTDPRSIEPSTPMMPPRDESPTVTHDHGSDRPARVGGFTPGTILAGRYRIVAPLGSGGAAEVYRAEDTRLGQTVALKFVADRITHQKALLDRIIAEVRIGRQASHPNLCRIYDIGELDDHYFITMEYVDGENLASLLRRVGRLPEYKALEVARELCAGLAAAHDRGVIHRDLKPANVMIDARGHARITDFGLAVVSGAPAVDSFAGTPAYMAPEQLEGAEATEQSDIYALGLVLYEIFTGARLFTGSVTEIVAAHGRPKPRPSSIVRGLSPAVERVILQCIEERPSDRPDSVRDVLAQLPGGDSLRSVIEAGETPSPREVASAESAGELSVAAAWSVLVAIVLLLAVVVGASRYTKLYRQVSLSMSPDVLTERAREVIRAAGYEPRPRGSRRWMDKDVGVLKEVARRGDSLDRSPLFRRVSPLRFGYRESPVPLIPRGRGGYVTAEDPPIDFPGMTLVVLDSRGHLVEFVRQPEPNSFASAGQVNWAELFQLAGLSLEQFTPDRTRWVSPVDHQQKEAWTGSGYDMALPLVVRAAAAGGRPVYFSVDVQAHGGALEEARAGEGPIATEQFTGITGFAAVFLVGAIIAAVVARRNLRLGRGDRVAATKMGAVVFGSMFVANVLSADHTTDAAFEWARLVGTVGSALFHAASFWLFYIAAEPYVRRRQPELLISWSRAIRGYYRDALVARHVFLGVLLGLMLNLVYAHLLMFAPAAFGLAPPLPDHAFPLKLLGGIWPFVSLTAIIGQIPLQSVAALFMFSALRSVLQRDWAAAAGLIGVCTVPYIGRDLGTLAEIPFTMLAVAIFIFALCRLGLLAGMVTLFVGTWVNVSVFIFDPRSWLFVPSLVYLSVTLLITLYGFRYALGTKPLLGRVRLAE